MQPIEFVKVDFKDRRPTTAFPARHGPDDPVPGIEQLWYVPGKPTRFFGLAPDDADLSTPGVLRAIDEQEWTKLYDTQLTLEKQRVIGTINAAYQAEMNVILAEYPDAETKTWDKQEAEARAWEADTNAETPLLDRLASERGLALAELVPRVLAKADAWISLSGTATGKRQRLEDAAKQAATLEDARAVQWPVTL